MTHDGGSNDSCTNECQQHLNIQLINRKQPSRQDTRRVKPDDRRVKQPQVQVGEERLQPQDQIARLLEKGVLEKDKKYNTLVDMSVGALFQKLKQFDEVVLKDGAVNADLQKYEQEIDEHLEKEAAYLMKALENGKLSDDLTSLNWLVQ